MPNLLPKMNPINPPMTRGQRRAWIAMEEQRRRRARGSASNPPDDQVPAIVLTSDGHGRLAWTLNFPSALGFNIFQSEDGVTWGGTCDGRDPGALSAEEVGIPGYFRICQCDGDGNDVLPYSNVVYSDGQ
jgi:hypothetical protein